MTHMKWTLMIAFAMALLATEVRAQDADVSTDDVSKPDAVDFAVAAKVGGTFHTIFNELSPFVLLELEGGILLKERHLELDLAVGWARPPYSYDGDDPRLTAESFDWKIQQDFFYLGVVGRWRFLPSSSRFNVYGALGPRLLMLRTVVEGDSDGESFGTNKQFETRFAGAVAVGGELTLGPGAILLEAGITFGNLDGFITGDTSSAALDVLLGYRFMF